MIPVTTFKGQEVALFGLGGSGLATPSALWPAAPNVTAWDDNPASVEKARSRAASGPPICATPTGPALPPSCCRPGVPLTHPKPHWTVDLARPPASRSSAMSSCSCASAGAHAPDCAVHRHHRHQRQVDHDGADCPYPEICRARHAARRQYRHGGADARSAGGRPLLCGRVLVLPDRSRAFDQSDGRHPAQPDARSSRPARHDAALCGVKERLVAGAGPRSSATTTVLQR
jgi:hypothetical protein